MEREEKYLTGLPLYLFLASLVFAEAAAGFETSMIFAAIGKLVQEFKDPSTAGWLVTIYMLVGAGSAAIIGRLGDQYGHRSVAIVLLLAGAVGSVLSLTVHTYWAALTGRALQGLTAALLPLCFGMIRAHVRPKLVPIAVGLMVTGSGIGAISGLLFGGMIVDNFPWRSIFIASTILAGLASFLLYRWAPPSQRSHTDGLKNVLTGLVFVPAIGGLLLAVSQTRNWGFTSPISLSLYVVSIGLFAFWIWRSLAEDDPLIDIRLFANRNSFICVVCMALLSLGALQVHLVFPLMLQQPVWTGIGLGVTATMAGLVKLPSNVLSLGGGPLSGWLSSSIGNQKTMWIGVMITSGGWLFASMFNDSLFLIALVLCVISFGTTIIYAALPNILIQSAPVGRTSEATGMLFVVRAAFMAIGSQLVAEGLSLNTITDPAGSGAEYPSETSYVILMVVVAAITVSIAIVSFLLKTENRQTALNPASQT